MSAENSVQAQTYQLETTAGADQRACRKGIDDLFQHSPLTPEDLLFNIGLYIRSSVLVKYLVMSQVYERVKHLPGVFMEFGVWYGQTMVLLENLRAIHEPFNKQRRIIGFDTFDGYTGVGAKDKSSIVWNDRSYATGASYVSHLSQLLELHEGANVLGHLRGRHQIVKGDITETVPRYFAEHPETIVAFALFDVGLYQPTKAAMDAVVAHSVPGTVLLLDELTWPEAPGEAIAVKEVFAHRRYTLEKIALYPSKSLLTIL